MLAVGDAVPDVVEVTRDLADLTEAAAVPA